METKRQLIESYGTKGEVPFMKELLVPLFDSMGFKKVEFTHGPLEMGKDFVISETNKFGTREYYVVVVKKGDIQNTSEGSGKSTLAEVERQVGQCLQTKVKLINDVETLPSKVIICCSGRVSANAKEQIIKTLPTVYNSSHVEFLSQEDLLPLVEKYLPHFFDFKLPVLGRYLSELSEKLKEESSIDSKHSKILGKIEIKCSKAETAKVQGAKVKPEEYNISDVLKLRETSWLQGGSGYGKTFTAYQFINKTIDLLKADKVVEGGENKDFSVTYYLKAKDLKTLSESPDIVVALHEIAQQRSTLVAVGDIEKWLKNYSTLLVIDEFERNPDTSALDDIIEKIKPLTGEPSVLILSRLMGDLKYNFKRKAHIFYIKDLKLSDSVDLLRSSIPSTAMQAHDCLQDLVKNGVLERIPRSALAINVLSHLFSGKIESSPNNAFEFFDMFFQLVLGRWRVGRDLNKAYDYRQIRSFFELSAHYMLTKRSAAIKVEELEPIAKKLLEGVNEFSLSPKTYIYEICDGSEVAKITNEIFEFSHKAYLEFLAGCEIADHHWNEDFFLNNLIDPNWEDALIFAAGSQRQSDSLLLSLDRVKGDSLEERFYKLKNISLTLQALYQSQQENKLTALQTGLNTVIAIRDDQEFKNIIKKRFPDTTDLTSSMVAMGLFSTFYGRKVLSGTLLHSLLARPLGRERSYLVTALASIDLKDEFKVKLKGYIENFNHSSDEPETLALHPFLENAKKVKGFDSKVLAIVTDTKKIKTLGVKTRNYLEKSYKRLFDKTQK